ncbi:MurR/RpiR family transcriptional regulator [Rhodobacteraceae bacterium NNCM2]|nr:MurR/RpiR family transcriptional regulator [Coraliihabitans acroporae]
MQTNSPDTTPPDSADAVIARLTAGFVEMPPQLQRAARYLIDNPREVGVQSMRALAGKAEVHPNTLVRLAQSIGFDGYEPMRERFRDFMVTGGHGGFRDRADWLRQLAAKGGTASVLGEMAGATAANLDAMWQGQRAAQLEAVADAMLAAPRVYVLGMGSAYSLAHQFWYVARMGFDHIVPIPRHGSQPIDDLAWMKPGEVLVALSFQPYRAETMQAVEAAHAAGVTVVGVSDSVTSPLLRLADHALVSPTHTPQFFQSHAAVTALMEGLLAILVSRAGEEAAARIEAFHQRRLDAGLYAEPAPLVGLG